jgi:hypothetical protein
MTTKNSAETDSHQSNDPNADNCRRSYQKPERFTHTHTITEDGSGTGAEGAFASGGT